MSSPDVGRSCSHGWDRRYLFLMLLTCAIAAAICGCGSPSAPDEPTVPIHLYPAFGLDPAILCSHTRIKVLYFVPRGQESAVYPEWEEGARRAFARVATFFDRELEGNLTVAFDVLGTIVRGEKTEYVSEAAATAEIQRAVFDPGGVYYEPSFATESRGEYTVRMIFYVNGAGGNHVDIPSGAYPWSRSAYNPWFWLEEVDAYGSVNSAHEFGHLLGIPHPWEMDPPYADEPGNLMGYSTAGVSLMECFLLDEVKMRMGLRG